MILYSTILRDSMSHYSFQFYLFQVVSYFCDKQYNQKELGEKMTQAVLHAVVHTLGKPKQEIKAGCQSRILVQKSQRNAAYSLTLVFIFSCFLTHSRFHSQRYCHKYGLGLPILLGNQDNATKQRCIHTCLIHKKPSPEFPSSQVWQVDKKVQP